VQNDPISESLAILRDPEAMAQITEMMQDPQFQEKMRQMNADPQAISQQMEALMQDPEFVQKVERVAKSMEKMMQDPAFREQANRMAEDMLAGMVQQTRANPLASLLLAMNPAAPRVGNVAAFARNQVRHLDNVRMEGEPSDKAITLGAAALGAVAGVVLTGEVTGAALFASAAAYATTLDNSVGAVTKKAGRLTAGAYDKANELNEQYDVLPKVKGAADTVVTVADNLNKNYGVTDKIDEKLKLSATVDKATDKLDELKDSLTSKVDEISESATKSD
jgi:hypothetical protein